MKKKTHFNRYVAIFGIRLEGKIVLKQTIQYMHVELEEKCIAAETYLRSIKIISAMWFLLPTSPRSDKK